MRILRRLLVIVSLAGVFLPQSVAAGVDDFSFTSFEADYYLSRGADNVSHLQVIETLVAQFPDFDQNHGIERAIPETYDGHPVDLKIDSVKDGNGKTLNYTTTTSNDNLVLRIGDAGTYVHGEQTYVISYSLQNVTNIQAQQDEFYWDINGDLWSQTLDSVTARVHLNNNIAQQFIPSKLICFTGAHGSTRQDCTITYDEDMTGGVVVESSSTRRLAAGETLTVALGFNKDTFAAYQIPLSTLLLIGGLVVANVLAPLVALVVMFNKWRKGGRDPKGRGVIAPEYLPPKQVGVISSGIVLKEKFETKMISAVLIDLAVRHHIKIYETTKKVLLISKTSYELELTKLFEELRPDDIKVIFLLFGKSPTVGRKVKIDDLSQKLYKEANQMGKDVEAELVTADYFKKAPSKVRGTYMLVGGVMAFAPMFVLPFAVGVTVAGLIVMLFGWAMPARTQKGVELRDYLLGLRDYMKLAEADRLRVLQSPHGELTEKINVNDTQQLVKLYEHLLPYAVLFGIEKQWAEEFAKLYTQPPDWYSTNGAFQAGLFVGAMHSFTEVSTKSFAPPSSSSGSGFGGGGFSGGGGGGGGGGGW